MKKFIGLSFVALVLLSCSTENKFEAGNVAVEVKIANSENAVAILERVPRGPKRIPVDTITLNQEGKGQFQFETSTPGLYSIYVQGAESGEIKFIGNPGDSIITEADAKSLYASAKISGSPENNRFDSLTTFMKASKYYTDSLYDVFAKAKEKQMHFAIKDEFEVLYQTAKIREERYAKSYIDKNPNQFSNIIAVEYLNPKRNRIYFTKVDSAMMKAFPQNEDVAQFHTMIENIFAASIGRKAKNFTLTDINNKQVSLADFKGKYVLLDFWATTCRPCIQEIPNLKNVKEQLKDANFEIVSVCVDRNNPATLAAWKKIIEAKEANTWTQLYDAEGAATVRNYQIKYFPTMFLIGPDGTILDTGNHIRGANTLNVIKSFMKDE